MSQHAPVCWGMKEMPEGELWRQAAVYWSVLAECTAGRSVEQAQRLFATMHVRASSSIVSPFLSAAYFAYLELLEQCSMHVPGSSACMFAQTSLHEIGFVNIVLRPICEYIK